jgi:integrase/recombinase XerD
MVVSDEERIKTATQGMPKACCNKLLELGPNGVIIADYLNKYKLEAEKGVKDSTRRTVCNNLELFAKGVNKPFRDVTREDVLRYLDGLKKSEDEDPRQKWRGTATLYSIHITQFFKWFYYPDIGPRKRRKQLPTVVDDLPRYGKSATRYEAYDLWTEEDNKIFLRYCPYPKIKCYHAIAAFTGARPHEILNLKMGDIKWLTNGQPSFPVSGKTGRRQLGIMSLYYIDYLKKWIELHPKGKVPSSYLIYSRKTGGKLSANSLWSIYSELKQYFTKLLDEAIGQDDRKQIEQLLLKPWAPYVIRHSTATEYLVRKRRLSGNHANQWFGWKKESSMPAVYGHFYGNEAEELLAESFGVKSEIKKESIPELRVCTNINCKELNNPDAPFCTKCRSPLTVAGYMEEVNERDGKISRLEEMCKQSLELSSKQNGTISDYKGMVDDVNSRYDKLMGLYENLKSKYDTSVSIAKTALERVDELQSVMRGGLLIKPGRRTAEELQRRVKILLQVAPDWKERTASGAIMKLTPEEERKWMELINQPS